MNYEIDTNTLKLKDHRYGRFDKRMPIGPVQWDFHDLLWIHEGRVLIEFPAADASIEIIAPGGVLILPNTPFSGRTVGAFATASVCHFHCHGLSDTAFLASGHMQPKQDEILHIQNLVRLAMALAAHNRPGDMPRRQRLLRTILDCFHLEPDRPIADAPRAKSRLDLAWELAEINLAKMRTLSDVAGLIKINESGFRAMHRKARKTSAGEYLRNLRLKKAEELLATTGFSIGEISQQVGYAHAETLSAAFKKTRGKTPGQYRRWSNPFA